MRRLSSPAVVFMLVWLLLTPGCTRRPADGAVLVSVAISIAPAIRELARDYQRDHPEATLQFNTGASGVLLQQIRRGAPADLFISASTAEMDLLAEAGRIGRDGVVVLASNRLVMVTPGGGDASDGEALQLERYASIAIANPRTAPLGRYTQQALTALQLWDTLGARFVMGENARQVIEYVARGDADAGIVYASDAVMLKGRVVLGPTFDPATHRPVAYCGVVPNDARQRRDAVEFLSYLRSSAAADVLNRHGFTAAGN